MHLVHDSRRRYSHAKGETPFSRRLTTNANNIFELIQMSHDMRFDRDIEPLFENRVDSGIESKSLYLFDYQEL